jgi:hypothetical protein
VSFGKATSTFMKHSAGGNPFVLNDDLVIPGRIHFSIEHWMVPI